LRLLPQRLAANRSPKPRIDSLNACVKPLSDFHCTLGHFLSLLLQIDLEKSSAHRDDLSSSNHISPREPRMAKYKNNQRRPQPVFKKVTPRGMTNVNG
jgi:hypothetical protein